MIKTEYNAYGGVNSYISAYVYLQIVLLCLLECHERSTMPWSGKIDKKYFDKQPTKKNICIIFLSISTTQMEIYLFKSAMETPELCVISMTSVTLFDIFIINFQQNSRIVLIFPLLTVNKFILAGTNYHKYWLILLQKEDLAQWKRTVVNSSFHSKYEEWLNNKSIKKRARRMFSFE